MQENILEELLEDLLTNRISPEEARQFATLIDQPHIREKLEQLLEAYFDQDKYEIPPDPARQQQIKQLLLGKISGEQTSPGATTRHIFRSIRWAAAAILLFTLAGTGYLLIHKNKASSPIGSRAQRFKNDVQPGGNKAILRLSNGATIALDSAAEGYLASDGGAHVVKKDGALLYDAQTEQTARSKDQGSNGQPSLQKDGPLAYNDLSTPVAGQYHLVLPDGTKVWLDASSAIHFPTSFPAAAREVEISGQAYFEVAKKISQPFRVKVKNEIIEVLGTHFNINAYDDEKGTRTTLTEGSIKVTSPAQTLVLQPGQQVLSGPLSSLELTPHPDIQEILAWKDGLFSYNGADIQTIMRQVARWYGVHIVYQDRIREEFVAEIPREVSLSRLLILLEATRQVHFKIEGKTITVMK